MLPSRPVVLFCGALAGDGVARNTVHLANALSRRGVPVEVVCLRGGGLAADLRGPDITCLGSLGMPRPLALAAAIPALRRRLRTIDASVAVSMGNHAHLALWAALRGLPDVPRIYRISNDVSHGKAFGRMLGLRLVAADATRLVCVSRQIAAASLFRRARRDAGSTSCRTASTPRRCGGWRARKRGIPGLWSERPTSWRWAVCTGRRTTRRSSTPWPSCARPAIPTCAYWFWARRRPGRRPL